MDTKKFFKKTCDNLCITGYEKDFTDFTINEFRKYSNEISTDKLGNIYVLKKGRSKNKIMITTIINESSFMVSKIEKNGFVRFVPVGNFDKRMIVSQEVIIHGKKNIFGVIGIKPPHLTINDDKKKVIEYENLSIDTGYENEEVNDFVKVGDFITLKNNCIELLNENISSKTSSYRSGLASMYDCLKNLGNINLDSDICFVITTQKGCKVAAHNFKPDISILVNSCNCDYNGIISGNGPVIVMGPSVNTTVSKTLLKVSKKNNINYQNQVIARMNEHILSEIQASNFGIKTGLLSIPIKYIFSGVDTVEFKDILETSRLIRDFILEINSNIELEVPTCF